MNSPVESSHQRSASLIVMGVSGSGKSRVGEALAQALKTWTFVDGDAYHPPENVEKMRAGHPLNDSDREGWLRTLDRVMRDSEDLGVPLVLACSALKRRYRDMLRASNPARRFVVLQGSSALLTERLAGRAGHFMPSSLLQSQLDAYEAPREDEHALFCEIDLPPDVIVAQIVDRIHHGNWPD